MKGEKERGEAKRERKEEGSRSSGGEEGRERVEGKSGGSRGEREWGWQGREEKGSKKD